MRESHIRSVQNKLFLLDIAEQNRIINELRQAQSAAESANSAKSRFLSTMSHEIRTPLNAITGNLTLLGTTSLTGLQQKCMKDCTSAAQILMRIVNDILDFSKIEAGEMELVKESYSPKRMLDSLVNIFACRAGEKQLRLRLEIAGKLPGFILGDRQRLSQIISHLLANAIRFTNRGGVRLSASTKTSDQGTMQLVVTVSDSGIGISPEQQCKIFDSFSQLENFSTRENSGTGLGLVISKRLVGLMEGELALSSIPGIGTTFTVTIPVTICKAPEKVKLKRTIKRTARNILVVDDELFGRDVVAALLERNGHRVKAVDDAETVLKMLQSESFDILLSDISMPGMDGIQMAEIIRSGEREGINSQIPIIAVTAHVFPQDCERYLCCGINDYIAKPINFEALLGMIEKNCSNSSCEAF